MARVMIIDDSATTRHHLKAQVEAEGHEVVGLAGNGEDGLSQTLEHGPDLILLDMLMPRMDGLEFMTHLRKYLPEVPVLMISSVSSSEQILQARERGVSAYLLKPATDEKLKATMHRLLAPKPQTASSSGHGA